ncbi:MAG: hypothetical protein M1453_09395 [Acidobacteria bacterium]|nr:hypothetical protein [Acidobacteriota bacterium]MCL5288191.1 hypothetical protein [Acidobacteriota bacterium]
MADWRQIQARIRKARTAPDAVAKMTELFERTRDAMVAFELAKLHEKAGANEDAVTSYTVAFERFRRADWKKKAEEALVRLGAPVPTTTMETGPAEAAPHSEESAAAAPHIPPEVAAEEGESQLAFAHVIFAEAEAEKPPRELPSVHEAHAAAAPGAVPAKRGRRGRRGGRGRRRGGAREGVAPQPAAAPPPPPPVQRVERPRPAPRRAPPSVSAPPPEVEPGPISIEAALSSRSKAGDPALASRSAKLESQLRRLIAAPPHSTSDHDAAPAGPGVLLLSDSDLSTYYYVEACATLRIALRVLVQGQRGRERGESIRGRLAEHLDISESKVAKYLQEHCAIRWLQLDEGAAHFAHFAIALLRPALNE